MLHVPKQRRALNTEISVYYQNVRSLRTKINTLISNLPLYSHDVFIFAETCFNDDFHFQELGFYSCNIFRFDRCCDSSNFSRGCGVLIATASWMRATKVYTNVFNIEHLVVKCSLDSVDYIFCTFYLPPHSNIVLYIAMS